MKTCKQRTQGVLQKLEEKKRARKIRRTAILSAVGGAAFTALSLWLFIPFSTALPDISAHSGSEYYGLMQSIQKITYTPPMYANNFDKYIASSLQSLFKGATGGDMNAGSAPAPAPEGVGGYQEATDNQVAGVIEGDLIKRSDTHIYYLTNAGAGYALRVYSIAKEASALVAEYEITAAEGMGFYGGGEMYLSEDCTRVTLITDGYTFSKQTGWKQHTVLIGLNVSNLADIKETGRTYLSGENNSSRLVNGEFLVMNNFTVKNDPDFADETQFLPQYGRFGEMRSVAAEDIVAPDMLTTARYTLVCKIDEKTLETTDTLAFLSYSGDVYVSRENAYLTRSYSERKELEYHYTQSVAMTEISCVYYAGETLEYKGAFCVEGRVKDQYSMDEYNGVLRVATTTSRRLIRESTNGVNVSVELLDEAPGDNASLYLVDISDFEIVASVEKFAPQGESVQSVRFDKGKAYICTAIALTDPVFVFDLSDISNITYTDTGTIDGYSTSLVDFGDNLLLGIGYGDDWDTLKIETYAETETAVTPLYAYELEYASFSEDYKSYLIDRENKLIGLGVSTHPSYGFADKDYTEAYLLLGYGDGGFTVLAFEQLDGQNAYKRAVYIDGYLYAFSWQQEDEINFFVKKIV